MILELQVNKTEIEKKELGYLKEILIVVITKLTKQLLTGKIKKTTANTRYGSLAG